MIVSLTIDHRQNNASTPGTSNIHEHNGAEMSVTVKKA